MKISVSLTVILLLIWLHFIADFVLQSDVMAKAKSSDDTVLIKHVVIYSATFIPFALWAFGVADAAAFITMNYAGHFVTDYFTSRATTKLWIAGKRHWFFVVIGLDQAVHMTTLFATYQWIKP